MKKTDLGKFCKIIMASLFLCGFMFDCKDPVEVCLAVVDTAAEAIVRCEPTSDLEETKAVLLDTWAMGSCKTIKKIRDLDGLINDCLPWLKEVSCSVILSGRKPAACENQLLMSTDEL